VVLSGDVDRPLPESPARDTSPTVRARAQLFVQGRSRTARGRDEFRDPISVYSFFLSSFLLLLFLTDHLRKIPFHSRRAVPPLDKTRVSVTSAICRGTGK
jgi:hypothetical protein